MQTMRVSQTAKISATPEAIHTVIADYHEAHPAILPSPEFSDLTVEKGGFGAGTELRLQMNALGRSRVFHQIVSEPEPGRVIAETDKETGLATTFTIDPANSDGSVHVFSNVTIATDVAVRPGIFGTLERLITRVYLQRLYRRELKNLADYLTTQEVKERPTHQHATH